MRSREPMISFLIDINIPAWLKSLDMSYLVILKARDKHTKKCFKNTKKEVQRSALPQNGQSSVLMLVGNSKLNIMSF